MSEFEKSEWAEEKHAQEFMENADIYILERKRLFEVLKSFYRQFLANKLEKKADKPIKILDLGCGNGALTQELLKEDNQIDATLVDGSSEMLKNAREHFKSSEFTFVNKTFQELIENESEGEDLIPPDFDFVISSLAIHHLFTEEKKSLFQYIFNHLSSGGYFLNIEVVKAPSDELERWYRLFWQEWIRENEEKIKSRGDKPANNESFEYIPEQYKNNPDNHPDTLEIQLDALKSVGFKQVDCYYKYGIFSIYGGKK